MRRYRIQNTEHRKLGQSIAEYAVLISVIAAALLAMQLYMKRGIQSAIKYSTDQFGNQDWRETDPDKVMQQQTNMQSVSESSARMRQEIRGTNVRDITTTNETSVNSGVSVSWKEDEL